jgi:hypothetical protein
MGSNRHGQLGLSTAQQAAAAAAAATGVASSARSLAASRDEDPAAGCQQEQRISDFAAVLGPGSDSDVQEQVQQVSGAGVAYTAAYTCVLSLFWSKVIGLVMNVVVLKKAACKAGKAGKTSPSCLAHCATQ